MPLYLRMQQLQLWVVADLGLHGAHDTCCGRCVLTAALPGRVYLVPPKCLGMLFALQSWLLTRKMAAEGEQKLAFTIPIFEPLPTQVANARPADVCSSMWHQKAHPPLSVKLDCLLVLSIGMCICHFLICCALLQ
jgi:hypothetical protein